MHKLRRCEEIVSGNGHDYRFSGTIGNIEALSFLSGDPFDLFARLAEGKLPPADIRNTIQCTIIEIDGITVSETDKRAEANKFVEDFGLQDSSHIARLLVSHAVIGDVKKSNY